MSATAFPQGDQWKNPQFVEAWKHSRKEKHAAAWRKRFPALLLGAPLAADPSPIAGFDAARELTAWENETLGARARRIESPEEKSAGAKKRGNRGARYALPDDLISKTAAGAWYVRHDLRATAGKIEKSKCMYESGLTSKAQREIGCGTLGGEVVCRTGHVFRVPYECGNRYCVHCGPKGARRLFAKQFERLLFVGTQLMMCPAKKVWGKDGQILEGGQSGCEECSKAIEEKRLPHWPPAPGTRPRMVVAQVDFTLRHEKNGPMPGPENMKQLNVFIRRFCRALERRFGISRKAYGLAFCDELGENNSNPHAHGLYVGPWLPQSKKEKQLSKLWREITGDSFVISIKFAENFAKALFHAVKYPAKFADNDKSSPQRLAELERIFHKMRRFHTLASFYNPEAPKPPAPPAKKCPICEAALSAISGWRTLAELEGRGLRDLDAVKMEIGRAAGLSP